MSHKLDIKPNPDETPLFINDPRFADESISFFGRKEESQPDHIRVYVPLDLSKNDILRRLRCIINKYGAASEDNEMNFSFEVSRLVRQIEVYDQIWLVRDNDYRPDSNGMLGGHSRKAAELVKEFIEELRGIEDDCAECFPFDLIRDLTKEYLTEQ